ncbi:MAG: alpha/beta fold hydrolase [Acidobacteria bacterium]|nr:alpha/beta fold hydrolase [Acidobacteriota bacterium]
MKNVSRTVLLLSLFTFAAVGASAQEQKFADLGDFKLESGEVIKGCRIGYRTFGTLNGDKSNVVLFPTWASGTTEQLASNFGPGRLVDTSKFYVVAVDALGNGVSSSPSNSTAQPRMKFPRFTVRDMVETQHHLLTKVLGISHVRAVMGISMGGMQTFQWMVAYPDFMERAIPIVGSPRLAPYDLLLWQAQIDAIMNDPGWRGGEYTEEPARAAEYEFGALLLTTPEEFNRRMTREKLFKELGQAKTAKGFDANDKIRQDQAMMALDVAAPFGGSLERAAAAVRARVLVVVARQDHVVTPGPAAEFARLLKAQLLTLEGDCGHLAPGCESQKVNPAVADFLSR